MILTRRSGKSLRRYMLDELFRPMGIGLGEWDRDSQGRYLGGNNMSLRPRDMLKFGQLYVNGGRFEGQQLVPEDWITASWRPTGSSPWNGHGYGYLWWLRTFSVNGQDFEAYRADGWGGQQIVVFPDLDMAKTAYLIRRRHARSSTNCEPSNYLTHYMSR